MIEAVAFLLQGASMLAAPQPRTSASVDSAVVLTCSAPLRQSLPAPGRSVTLSPSHDGLLGLVEHGQEIAVEGGDVVEITMPLRFGKFSVLVHAGDAVHISRARPGSAQGFIEVGLNCEPGDDELRARAWQVRVQAFEKQIAEPQPASAYDRFVPQLDAIRAGAPPGYSRALADHLRAQLLAMTGHSADATAAFARARQSWLSIGDNERALAALVAEAEDLLRAGAYADVLTRTRSLAGAPDRNNYFGVRLEDARCLALEYQAQLDSASACFEWTISALADLGETLERISTQQDYAQVELDRGKSEHAESLASDALAAISSTEWDMIAGADIPIVRGRVERLLSDLSLRKGDIAESLRHSQRALALFTRAKHPRWQANMLLRIAATYRDIGAYADALDAVDFALQRLSVRDAPARIAMAEFAKARIGYAQGDMQMAIEHGSNARTMFESLQMPADAGAAALTLADAKVGAGQFDEARAILDSIKAPSPTLASRAQLVAAEIAAGEGSDARPKMSTDELQRSAARPLSDWLRVQAVVAKQKVAAGQPEEALRILEQAALHVTNLAARARNPILRLALERQKRQLLSTALPIIESAGSVQDMVAAAWRWLLLTEATWPASTVGQTNSKTEDFDRALASSLMPHPPSGDKPKPDDSLQQHLLELVANASAASTRDLQWRVPDATVVQLQETLPHGTAFLALLSGGAAQALLYISSDKADLFALPAGADSLRKSAVNLATAVVAEEPLSKIDRDAAELSHELLGTLSAMPVPQRLLIVASEPFNSLPWALLTWPGSSHPLIETTTVSFAVPGSPAIHGTDDSTSLHVFAANAQPHSQTGELQGLAAAGGELSNIERQRRQRGWRVYKDDHPSRVSVLSALGDGGSWVHVAGHGSSMTEYLGRSGIWLTNAEQRDEPELLSWMDVVEHGVRSDVVVLNACALAGSAATSLSASGGFADATLRAGANQVLAALWSIDDTAAWLWSSTFYAHLSAHPDRDEIADALRASMLRLRDTRAFRHPRYWASLVHLARIDLPAMTNAAPRAAAR